MCGGAKGGGRGMDITRSFANASQKAEFENTQIIQHDVDSVRILITEILHRNIRKSKRNARRCGVWVEPKYFDNIC